MTHQADQEQGVMQGDLGVLGRRGDRESGVRSIERHDRRWQKGVASQRALDATTHLQAVGAAEGPRERAVGSREQRSPWSAGMAPAAAFYPELEGSWSGQSRRARGSEPSEAEGQIAPSGTQRDLATPALVASGYGNKELCKQAREGRKSAASGGACLRDQPGRSQHGPRRPSWPRLCLQWRRDCIKATGPSAASSASIGRRPCTSPTIPRANLVACRGGWLSRGRAHELAASRR